MLRNDSVEIKYTIGTTLAKLLWIENFYSAIILVTWEIFKYKLAQRKNAVVHAWCVLGLTYLFYELINDVKMNYLNGKKIIPNFRS